MDDGCLGILHEEFHSRAFTKKGGTLEMVQLWVNLPAKDKNADPGYQTLLDADIPAVDLPDGAGKLRVIAGGFDGRRGPAKTLRRSTSRTCSLTADGVATLNLPEGHTVAVVVLKGTVLVNGSEIAREAQFVLLDRSGGEVTIEANSDARAGPDRRADRRAGGHAWSVRHEHGRTKSARP